MQFQYRKIFLLTLLLTITLSNTAQQQFIHTATKANNSCNGDCTQLDIPELNNNPEAILYVTPVLDGGENLNPHLIGVYYFNKKWNIFNLDQKALPAGSKFNVQYFARSDSMHFKYAIKNENIRRDGSAYIDHPALSNNPNIKFLLFHSWIPVDGGAANRYEIKVQFDSVARKWFISNINERYLFARITYNIAISSGDIANKRDSSSNKAIEIKELIIRPTITETTISEDPTKKDSVKFEKNIKTIIKREDSLTGINTPIDKNAIIKRDSLFGINTPIDKNATVKRDSLFDINTPIDKNVITPNKIILPSYDFSKIQICIEKAAINNLPPKSPATSYPAIPKIKPNGELEPVSTITQPLSGVTDQMWSPGEEISVGFFSGGSSVVTDKIKNYVKEWETYANIKFVFINDVSKAMIKVGFKKDNTSWSWLGRSVLVNPASDTTMNFGWFNSQTSETEFSRTTLHEFGHALGFIHEHQAPTATIPWDSAKVYAYYAQPSINWSKAKVDHNIFEKFSTTGINSSTYDALSIMHYFFPATLTTDGTVFTQNTNLSTVDKAFVKQVYPFPPAPPAATGVLKTGDDCDEIEFTVEYNVVHKSEIEFILQPGYDHHNALVNWWKMIGITQTTGIVTGLELNNTKKIPVVMIDKNKAITFAKAKVLGVHTGLAFTWPVWPAIVGGCRVKFVWRRDSCN